MRRGTEQRREVRGGKEKGGRERGGGEVIRTDADEGGKEKNLWEGEEGEILIWRGKRAPGQRRALG